MKVILMTDVKALGRRGEVVNVSDGYAMNFLFPQNMAVQATAAAMQRMREQEAKAARLAKKGEAEAKKAASALDGYELILKEKASGKGIFYAAVNARTVAVALKKAGYAVTPEMVGLADPIKEATEQEVTVSFPHGFEANIKLIVEANT